MPFSKRQGTRLERNLRLHVVWSFCATLFLFYFKNGPRVDIFLFPSESANSGPHVRSSDMREGGWGRGGRVGGNGGRRLSWGVEKKGRHNAAQYCKCGLKHFI